MKPTTTANPPPAPSKPDEAQTRPTVPLPAVVEERKTLHAERTRRMTQPEPEKPTHLMGRSKRPQGFTRAGIRFVQDWEAWPLADLGEERVARILAEDSMIEARLVTASEVAGIVERRRAVIGDNVSRPELLQTIEHLLARVKELETRNTELERRMSGAVDSPPANVDDLPGMPPASLPPRHFG